MSVRRAFAQLHRALLARTTSRIEPRLRVELGVLALLTWGFTFWRARIPFDALTRERGWGACALALSSALGFLAVVGATAAALHHVRQLQSRAAGPAWLALPLPADAILGHLAWRSRWQGAWAVILAPGVLAAAIGLVPWWAIVGLATVFVFVLVFACRLATHLVRRRVLARAKPKSAIDAMWVLLTTAARPTVATRLEPPAWRRRGAAVALVAKDLRLARRATAARARMIAPLLFALLSAVVWWVAGTQSEIPTELVRFVAFGLALVASAAFAEWLIALAASDPSPVLRSLPLGAGDVWRGRALLLVGFVLLVVAGQVVAARPLAEGPLQVHLVWLGAATLAIGLLGIHYSLTLPAAAAAHVLVLTLSITMAASIMIPLLGWVLLLTAVIHSARRVPRWPRIEETA